MFLSHYWAGVLRSESEVIVVLPRVLNYGIDLITWPYMIRTLYREASAVRGGMAVGFLSSFILESLALAFMARWAR